MFFTFQVNSTEKNKQKTMRYIQSMNTYSVQNEVFIKRQLNVLMNFITLKKHSAIYENVWHFLCIKLNESVDKVSKTYVELFK